MRTLFYNGRIFHWTTRELVTPQRAAAGSNGEDYAFAEWLVADADGRVERIGCGECPLAALCDTAVDLRNKVVLPGLIDAHIHMLQLGQYARMMKAGACASIEELQTAVRSFAASHPEEEWICGEGWAQDKLGRYPSRHDLDAAEPSRPVLLLRVCSHIGVANTAALKLLGVTADTPDPEGGVIDRDEAGEPTGILREKALWMRQKHVPLFTPSEANILRGADECIKHGITAVQSNDPLAWPLYKSLAEGGQLPLRVFLTVPYQEQPLPTTVPAGTTCTSMLRCDRIKMFADGSLGAETAALSMPYATLGQTTEAKIEHAGDSEDLCKCSHSGVLVMPEPVLVDAFKAAHDAGYRIEVHVIGDRSAEVALRALRTVGVPPSARPVLTHCQVLRKDLIDQMVAAGAVANIQPQFVPTDAAWVHKRLNPALLPYSYAWKSLLEAGIVCSGGSDAPVEAANAFMGLHDAILRPDGTESGGTFVPTQCLSLEAALHLYTDFAAYAACMEKELGNLAPGYWADFVVLDTDPFADGPSVLKHTHADVWVAATCRYRCAEE